MDDGLNPLSNIKNVDGYLDVASGDEIAGWAWDRNYPNEPLEVEIYDDDLLLAKVVANMFRPDLLEEGLGNGKHAFAYRVPDSLDDGREHLISVRVSGSGRQLSGSPRTSVFVKPMRASRVLTSLYTPPQFLNIRPPRQDNEQHLSWRIRRAWRRQRACRTNSDVLPVPPPELRMEHSDDDAEYLMSGKLSADFIRQTLAEQGVRLSKGDSLLDWGCASGRVLRHFVPEATQGQAWGTDQHGPCIAWAKEHLSPPFRFATCTAYPHLPFEDNRFKLVFGYSVLTHIAHLLDMWLLELRRIMAPGGCGLFTVHDERSWQMLREDEAVRRHWLSHGWIREEELVFKDLEDDVVIVGKADAWDEVITFFRHDWIKHEWGQVFESISFTTQPDMYQSTVVVRKM